MSIMFAYLFVYHIKSDPVQHNKPIVTVLYLLARNNEYGSVELWNIYFPVPSQVTDFTVSTSRVHCEQCHAGEMGR